MQTLNPAHWIGRTGRVVEPGDHGAVELLLHATFLFGLVPAFASSSGLPDWNLSLEMQFYAVFPLIFVAARRWGVGRVCLLMALVAAVVAHELTAVTDRGWIARFPEPSPLPVRFGMFMVGCLLYEAGRTQRPTLFCLAAVVLIIATRLYGALGTSFLAVIIGLFGWLWTDRPRAAVRSLMRSRPVRFLSDTSYGLYLFHGFALSLLGSRIMAALGPGLLSVLVMTAAVVPAAYALAWLVFRFVKRPGIQTVRFVLRAAMPVDTPVA